MAVQITFIFVHTAGL